MNREDLDRLTLDLFTLFRDDIRDVSGSISLIDSGVKPLRVLLKSRFPGHLARPGFRLLIEVKFEEILVVQKQWGFGSKPPLKTYMKYAKGLPKAEKVRRVIGEMLNDERFRLIEYRKITP